MVGEYRHGLISIPINPCFVGRLQWDHHLLTAAEAGASVEIEIAVNEQAFEHLQKGEIDRHNELVHQEMDRLAERVDVLVSGPKAEPGSIRGAGIDTGGSILKAIVISGRISK